MVPDEATFSAQFGYRAVDGQGIEAWWEAGFGQTLRWRGRELTYHFRKGGISGTYTGKDALELSVQPPSREVGAGVHASTSDGPLEVGFEYGAIVVKLEGTDGDSVTSFEIEWP